MGIFLGNYNPVKEMYTGNIKLSNFKLTTKEIDLSGTPATQYIWTDNKGDPVAQFTTFKWWDGKNIENLRVHGDYKGKGLSYQLLDYAVHKLGCRCLAVEKSNSIAKHVYDKYGFKVIDQDKDRYYMKIDLHSN